MRVVPFDAIVEAAKELFLETHFQLREDIRLALEEACLRENEPARTYLGLLLENAEIAIKENIPLCRDTGLPIWFIEMGCELGMEDGLLRDALQEGMKQAFLQYPFQSPILLDPLDPRSNLPDQIPPMMHLRQIQGSNLRVTCIRATALSELNSRLGILRTGFTNQEIVHFVRDTVKAADAWANPPVIVGVGIGAALEDVGRLAKSALLRPVGKPHQRLEYARLEQDMLVAINQLGIGPGGIGGETTALAVHLEAAPCHRHAIPIAVFIQSHAVRMAEVLLSPEV
jgi:fumarate hydratase subunit alpha